LFDESEYEAVDSYQSEGHYFNQFTMEDHMEDFEGMGTGIDTSHLQNHGATLSLAS
jgi:hypothetical protein